MKLKSRNIYTIILIILNIALFVCIVGIIFFQNNKNTSPESSQIITISSPPIIEISWEEAVSLLQECKITAVFQKRNLTVTLTDKNNQIYQTKEPKKNDVIYQTNHLRSDCNDIITTITE